jgi:hypothetical protein
LDKADKDERRQSLEEIAEAVGEPVGTIGRILSSDDFLRLVSENQMKKIAMSHADGFTPPLYNIWTKQTKTNAVSH